MDRESLTVLLDQGLSVEKIARRFGKHPSTVTYWMAKYGLEAPNRERYAARGGIEQAELTALVEAGMSIGQMAEILNRGKATIRYWLRKYELQTARAGHHASQQGAEVAKDAGLLRVTMHCPSHGEAEFVLEGRGYYRCTRCRSQAVTERRRRAKSILVAEAGGRCVRCGYARCQAALEFHHLDPATKRIVVSAYGRGLGLDALRKEAAKCVLLCSNCHAEVESGLPLDSATMRESGPPLHNPG